jgi:hypothetical protein
VVWRQGGGNVGWFPMPPDDRFLAGDDVYRDDWNWDRGNFGYSDWYGPSILAGLTAAWTFVALDHFADRDYYNYARPRTQIVNIINNTTNVTNYVTVNNRIVNRSVDVAQVERASGRQIQRVAARDVVRTPIETVDAGRQIATRERQRHGGDVRAPARDRVQPLPAAEARVPVRERRSVQLQRDQQGQQPQAQQQQPNAQDRRDQQQQGDTARQREERANQQREQRQRPGRDTQLQQPQRDGGAAAQADVEQQQQRAQAEQQNRARADQAEKQQRDQAERQRRSQADQPAQQPRAAVQPDAERQQRAQADQQNRQQQQAAAAEERQQRARAQKGKTPEEQQEEERVRRERQK